uniref:Cytochrome P450 n=2 Tax=Chenopodium quinoa TaxID=63459 RepID=A0A803LD47_CHEQI
MSAILGDLLGKGIFIVDGEHWKFQRKIASLELGSVSVRAYAHEVLNNVIEDRLFPALLGSPVVDLQDVLKKFSFVNICKFSFGVDPAGLDGLAEAFDVASMISSERALCRTSLIWRAKRVLNIGSERKLKGAISKVNYLAESIIRERRKKEFNNKSDLLSRFMGSVSDDKYLRDIVVSFLLAGRDTVASGLTVFFYLMARNPSAEARILEESNRVLGRRSSSSLTIPSMEELRKMHYLQGAVYETLRLYPPVQMDSKFAKNDDVLPDGTYVKKGTRVAYHPYAMGRMETIWGPDCLEFKPERWLNNEGVFVPENPYRYPVFQAGVRPCLGKDMGLLAMKVVALAVVRQFHIKLANPSWAPQFVPGLTATLKGGMPVVVTERLV